MPRLFSTATCALRIFDAATIFMALVIFPMFLIARMRCFTARQVRRNAQEQPMARSAVLANPH